MVKNPIVEWWDGSVVDEVSFGAQIADISAGRCANGSGAFVTMASTFGKANICTTGTEDTIRDNDWTIVPNLSFLVCDQI